MSDQQQENEITTTQAAPAVPVASDQVAAPAQASAPETPKAASTPMPVAAEKAVPATGEEAAPAKPKRTRRTAKPAADGEEVTKPKRRTTRTTRAKLMSYLSAEAQRRGAVEFDIPFSRQQLADFLAVERSGLSLELGKMKKEGLLDYHKEHFVLNI